MSTRYFIAAGKGSGTIYGYGDSEESAVTAAAATAPVGIRFDVIEASPILARQLASLPTYEAQMLPWRKAPHTGRAILDVAALNRRRDAKAAMYEREQSTFRSTLRYLPAKERAKLGAALYAPIPPGDVKLPRMQAAKQEIA